MIDLLRTIRLPDHAVEGNWRMIDGALVCGASRDARVMAPIALLRNYEVRLDFTRTAGAEAIAVVCPIVGRTCVVSVGGWTGKYGGLQRIDGKALPEINDKQAVISPAKLENGRLYMLQVNVQESRGTVTINAALNRQQFVKWRGTAERLSAAEHFMLPSLRTVGVFAFDSTVTIHSFGVQLTPGGEGYQLGDDWKNPLDVVADAPHKKLLTDCITGNGRNYLIAPKPTTHSEAQRLAASVQGRLVTISSVEENKFLFQAAKGRQLWTSAWRSGSTNDWRDERNRPLRTFWWAAREPNNAFGRQFRIMTAGTEPTLWDKSAWDPAYACIEWGEE